MKTLVLAFSAWVWATAGLALGQQMEIMATFETQQVTGVAVSKTGRLFVCFPNWSDQHGVSVVEVAKSRALTPFPNEDWNRHEEGAGQHWTCVQSLSVDDNDALWVLDSASPKMEGVAPGGAKLVKFDLTTNEPALTIRFDEFQAPPKSYLNDLRVDTNTNQVYITDSGLGALVVVNLETGKIRRLLADHPATKAEANVELTVDGHQPVDPHTGRTPQIHADGIALDAKNGYLYFHALTGHTLYRVKTQLLRDEKLEESALADSVELVGETPACDGMLADERGNILLTAIERNAIGLYRPGEHSYEVLFQDKRLQWPDSMAWGPDGALYVTTSQIHRTPRFNRGHNDQVGPFAVWRVNLTRTAQAARPEAQPHTAER